MIRLYFFILCFLHCFFVSAQTKKKVFVDLTTAMYNPYLTFKIDFNVGLSIKKKNESMFSIGVDPGSINDLAFYNEKKIGFNIKEVFIFKKKIYKIIQPLCLVQFKHNNYLIYNKLEPNPASNLLFLKNSFISQIGLQISDKKMGFRIQFQSGVTDNFIKLNFWEPIIPKVDKDKYFNFINSISLLKVF